MRLKLALTLERSWSLLLVAALFCAVAGLAHGQSTQSDQGTSAAGQEPKPDAQQTGQGQSAIPANKADEQKSQPQGTAAPAITPVGTTSGAPAGASGNIGSAITPVGTTNSGPATVKGNIGSAITPIGSGNGGTTTVKGSIGSAITPIGSGNTVPTPKKGSVGSALDLPAPATSDTDTNSTKPSGTQGNALPNLTPAPTTNFSTTVKDEPGEAIESPKATESGAALNGNPGAAVSAPSITHPNSGVSGDTGAAVSAPSVTHPANAVSGDTGSAVSTPKTAPSNAVNGEPGSAVSAPTLNSSGKPVEGDTGAAVSQPEVKKGTQAEGDTGNAVNEPATEMDNAVSGEPGAAVNPPAMTNGARVIEGDTGSAIAPPSVARGNAASGDTGSAVNSPATLKGTAINGDTGSAVNSPETLKGLAASGDTGSAVNQPASAKGLTASGDTGSAVNQPASAKGLAASGDTGVAVRQPTSAKGVAVSGDTGNAVEQPRFVGAKFVEGETRVGVSAPVAGAYNKPSGDTGSAVNSPETLNTAVRPEGDLGTAVHQPALASANAVMGDTLKAIEQPMNNGRLWQPDNPTNVAMGDVNYASPQLIVPGVAPGHEAYIHLAVEPTHLAHSTYKFANGTGKGVDAMVLVQQKDVHDYGSAMRQMTYEGHLVINVPQGWRRSSGFGLLYYVPEKTSKVSLIKNPLHDTDATIYATAIHIDPSMMDRDTNDFVSADTLIRSDIAGYRQRFKRAIVREAEPVTLPLSSAKHVTYMFQSREKMNAYEEVVYIDEGYRVLALTLSTSDMKTFRDNLPTFLKFVKTYQGNIPYGQRAPQ